MFTFNIFEVYVYFSETVYIKAVLADFVSVAVENGWGSSDCVTAAV